jgi:hypothetical protein
MALENDEMALWKQTNQLPLCTRPWFSPQITFKHIYLPNTTVASVASTASKHHAHIAGEGEKSAIYTRQLTFPIRNPSTSIGASTTIEEQVQF